LLKTIGLVSRFAFYKNHPIFAVAKGGVYTMIIVNVKENESIEKALKRFKKKFDRTGAIRELRARQYFEKPSIRRRGEVIKAAYKQRLQDEEGK
jgi:small subunit ribosomal protein S21